MPRKSQRPQLKLNGAQCQKLITLRQSRTAPLREVQRASILLKYADGKEISSIKKELNIRLIVGAQKWAHEKLQLILNNAN